MDYRSGGAHGPGGSASLLHSSSTAFIEGQQYSAEAGQRLGPATLRLLRAVLLTALCQGTLQQAEAAIAQAPQLLGQLLAAAPTDEAAIEELQLLLAALIQSHKALTAALQQQPEGQQVVLQARAATLVRAASAVAAAAPEAFGQQQRRGSIGERPASPRAGAQFSPRAGGAADSQGGLALPSVATAVPALAIPELLRMLRPAAVLGGALRAVAELQAVARSHEAAVQASWMFLTCGSLSSFVCFFLSYGRAPAVRAVLNPQR